MLYQVSATFSMLLLYALYIVLFTFSMYTVIRQNPAGRRFFLITSSIMFLLGTCDVIVSVFLVGIAVKVNKAQAQGSPDLPHLLQLYNTFFIVDAILMVANNLVTDVLFVRAPGRYSPCLYPTRFLQVISLLFCLGIEKVGSHWAGTWHACDSCGWVFHRHRQRIAPENRLPDALHYGSRDECAFDVLNSGANLVYKTRGAQ